VEDALNLIRDKLAKAEVKASRAEKAWESARNEVADLQTALRVMSELTGESLAPTTATASANVAERQLLIVRLLRAGEANAAAPAEVFDMYKLIAGEDISIDTFRTTIWRMKDIAFNDGPDLWLIKGDNGRYWKEPGTLETRKRLGETTALKTPQILASNVFNEEVPF
jgi:hypothetical protein